MKGLNHVSSICMGSSITEVANDWGWYRKCKISLGNDISQHFYCQHSKKLSHRATCGMASHNIEGSNMT